MAKLLGSSLRHGQESSPCLSSANASLYTINSFSVHTKTEHGNAEYCGKSVYVPARRRRDRLATFTIGIDLGLHVHNTSNMEQMEKWSVEREQSIKHEGVNWVV